MGEDDRSTIEYDGVDGLAGVLSTAGVPKVINQDADLISLVDPALDQLEREMSIEQVTSKSLFVAARGIPSAKLVRDVLFPAAMESRRSVIQASISRIRTGLNASDPLRLFPRRTELTELSASEPLLPLAHLDVPDQKALARNILRLLTEDVGIYPWIGRVGGSILLLELFQDPDTELLDTIACAANSNQTFWLHSPLSSRLGPILAQFASHIIIEPTPGEVELAAQLRRMDLADITHKLDTTHFALMGGACVRNTPCWHPVVLRQFDDLEQDYRYMSQPKMKAIVLTALPVEYKAFRQRLRTWRKAAHKGTLYEVGTLETGAAVWEILLAQIGPGNTGAAVEAERAMSFFEPRVAILLGVAGALKTKDIEIGDIVVAPKVYYYPPGKEADSGFMARPETMNAHYSLLNIAAVVARENKWQGRSSGAGQGRAKAVLKPIAAGERVLSALKGESSEILKSHYDDALAVEMEGFGFLRAVHQNEGVAGLVIRGISDFRVDKDKADEAGSQDRAARNAAAFARALLRQVATGQLGIPVAGPES